MRVALAVGGAACVWDDLERYTGPVHGVVACNDVGAEIENLTAWVSMHPAYWKKKGWIDRRRKNGFADVPLYSHKLGGRTDVTQTDYMMPGMDRTGSSGLFAAKVALVDLGFDVAVFCGVPMESVPHYFNDEPWPPGSSVGLRHCWVEIDETYRKRLRSMSGWTKSLLGGPEWIN